MKALFCFLLVSIFTSCIVDSPSRSTSNEELNQEKTVVEIFRYDSLVSAYETVVEINLTDSLKSYVYSNQSTNLTSIDPAPNDLIQLVQRNFLIYDYDTCYFERSFKVLIEKEEFEVSLYKGEENVPAIYFNQEIGAIAIYRNESNFKVYRNKLSDAVTDSISENYRYR